MEKPKAEGNLIGSSRHPRQTSPMLHSPQARIAAERDAILLPNHEANLEYENLVRRQLELLGEDPERDGLLKTQERVAKAQAWLTRGYDLRVEDVVGDAVFEESHENMVVVRDRDCPMTRDEFLRLAHRSF